jgi:hypothetical protein
MFSFFFMVVDHRDFHHLSHNHLVDCYHLMNIVFYPMCTWQMKDSLLGLPRYDLAKRA